MSGTLDRLADDPPSYTFAPDQRRLVDERVEGVREALETQPKIVRLADAGRVGERVRWYEEPEEI